MDSNKDQRLSDLRRYLRSIYDVCEECDKAGTTVSYYGTDFTVRQLFEVEVTAFMMHLTAADGVIQQNEIDFINELMGRSYSIEKCMAIARAEIIPHADFSSTTPLSFKILVDFAAQHGRDIADTLISFYAGLGVSLAASDEVVAAQETEVCRNYLHLLRGYKIISQADDVEEIEG